MFNLPYLNNPMSECIDTNVEKDFKTIMLGLGDVIVPGIFII